MAPSGADKLDTCRSCHHLRPFRQAADANARPRVISSCSPGVVYVGLCGPDWRTGRCVAGDQGGPARAGRRADRIGQDTRGVSRSDRRLVREGVEHGLRDETQVVYVSPLKALSNDIQQEPRGSDCRHPRRARTTGPARRRDPHMRAHRRHAAGRARRRCGGALRTSSSRRPNRCTSC